MRPQRVFGRLIFLSQDFLKRLPFVGKNLSIGYNLNTPNNVFFFNFNNGNQKQNLSINARKYQEQGQEEAKDLHCFPASSKIVVSSKDRDRGGGAGNVHKSINNKEYKEIFDQITYTPFIRSDNFKDLCYSYNFLKTQQ